MSRVCLLSLAALLACARAYEDAARKPAKIVDDENAATLVTGELGNPLHVPCLESENPTLFVFWYRGHGKSKLLKNDAVYEMRRNALFIRSLAIDSLGPYTCQAYSSEDMKPPRMFVVRAYMPDETNPPDSDWWVPRGTGAPSPETSQPLTFAATSMTTTEAPGLWFTARAEVVASEGDTVTLRCDSDVPWLHDNSSPKITWMLGELIIDGNEGRYRLLSDGALEIVSLYRNDTGVYICVADYGLGVATQEIQLVVNDPVRMPAGIAGDENAVVTGELGSPLEVRCLAYGYPPPSVFWYRGFDEEAMVIYNDMEYQMRGYLLSIKRLSIDRLGQYMCGAYNGVGQPASWKVVVRAYKPEGLFHGNEWLVPRDMMAPRPGTEPPTTVETTTTTTLRTTEAPRLLVSETSTAEGHSETTENTAEASEFITSTPSTTNEGIADVIATLDPDEASGPDGQGCPCNATEFGRCHGVSPVAGREGEGCTGPCSTSSYGCCQDDKTPAHGPDFEGCCLLQAFGCCPDNHKPTEGPHGEGCECQYTLHGCCPDNVTIARGPGNQGCGCQYTVHGCCPDKHTAASGPNNEGCACNTYQFGCCADGVTTATGPEQPGCHCRDSKFGCCGDDETPATGPDSAGCDCSSSRHGCCPDGRTEATGPKFLGCTDAPENKQAACSMSTDPGPCHNFTVMWYYDLAYGSCSRFWYGGCDGNGNRFSTKEECEDVCVQPSPKDACKLPSVKGACDADYRHWHYNSTLEQCIPFRYGGCLGNANNFDTQELCQKQCEPSSVAAQCTQPQDAGKCSEKEALWSFSQSENRCLPFYYSGCGGNDNRFSSREACEQTCPSAYVADKCTLPAETGQCSNYRERWFYDTTFKSCRQFYYGGCGGNENNFGTEAECDNSCSEVKTTTTTTTTTTTASPVEPQPEPRPHVTDQRPAAPDRSEFCFNAIDAGPCNNNETRYAYDSELGRCVTFQYGGCGGNQNNFPDEDYCSYYCQPMQDICQLPMLQGPCEDSLMRWFYDPITDSCSQFTYGGCDGNDNRFESLEACESRCRTGPAPVAPTTPTTIVIESSPECVVPEALEDCRYGGVVWFFDPSRHECVSHANQEAGPVCRHTGTFSSQEACERSSGAFRGVDVCKQRLDAGPCQSYVTKVYFDPSTGQCREFIYGGCLGGANRFSSMEECSQVCKSEIADPCTLPADGGSCNSYILQWYFDQERDQCSEFVYTGCSGNENRFETQSDCEARCSKRPAATTTTTAATPPLQLAESGCKTPSSLAPCGNNVTVFYYDSERRQCLVSGIGGCGHPNSYSTEEECERSCGAFRGLDVCGAHLDPGPCRASIPKIYWDALTGSCQPYAYGGCAGGPNRFSSVEECLNVCGDTGPELVVPAKCTDNPFFANCNLIVRSKFCIHSYFSKYCCKSCVKAGQLEPQDVKVQADQPYRKE